MTLDLIVGISVIGFFIIFLAVLLINESRSIKAEKKKTTVEENYPTYPDSTIMGKKHKAKKSVAPSFSATSKKSEKKEIITVLNKPINSKTAYRILLNSVKQVSEFNATHEISYTMVDNILDILIFDVEKRKQQTISSD